MDDDTHQLALPPWRICRLSKDFFQYPREWGTRKAIPELFGLFRLFQENDTIVYKPLFLICEEVIQQGI